MRIQLQGLPPGPQTFERRCSAGDYLDDRETFPEDIHIQATVQREGNSLRLSLEAELPGHFICDRCGQPFDRLHCCQDDFFFTFDQSNIESEDHVIMTIPESATELDISQEIRDLVILSLPFQILCHPDCRGLCPRCGTNLNIQECGCQRDHFDPRWEALKHLKSKNE